MLPSTVKAARKRRAAVGRPRLEVGGDRIRLASGAAFGREWVKSEGNLVTVSGRKKRAAMTVGADGHFPVPLHVFELAEVRAACLAHGWSWKEGRGPVLEAVPAHAAQQYGVQAVAAPAESEVELVLSESKATRDTSRALRICKIVMPIGVIGSVAVLAWLKPQFDVDLMWLTSVLLVACFGTLILIGVLGARGAGEVVTISRTRLTVRSGSLARTINRDDVDGPGIVGKRYIRFRAAGPTRDRVWVTANRRRDEVLTQLRAHSWELVDKG